MWARVLRRVSPSREINEIQCTEYDGAVFILWEIKGVLGEPTRL